MTTKPELASRVVTGLQQIASARAVLDAAGVGISDEARQDLSELRTLLRAYGFSEEQINATPGLGDGIPRARVTRLEGEKP